MPGVGAPQGTCACELHERFGLAQSKASHGRRGLKKAGLVGAETRGKWTFHAIDREAAAAAWRDLHALLRIWTSRRTGHPLTRHSVG